MEIATITVPRLALSFIPVAIVIVLMWRWSHRYGRALQAIARMLIQLTLIGYVLVYIFQSESGLIISGVLAIAMAPDPRRICGPHVIHRLSVIDRTYPYETYRAICDGRTPDEQHQEHR